MFNKREEERESHLQSNRQADSAAPQPASSPASTKRTEPAVIGPSIHIDGNLKGEEDLLIEGTVKGTVTLKSNALTVGGNGKVTADVYAKTIHVEGHMRGDLFAAELVRVGKDAKVQGNIASPRVSLEDGARFKGAIEMDPEAEALKSAFKSTPVKPVAVSNSGAQQESRSDTASVKSGSAA